MPTKLRATAMPRRELARVLTKCKNEQQLQEWLADEVKAGCLCGALMVQARYSAVRRRRELRDLKAAVVVNQMTEVTGR